MDNRNLASEVIIPEEWHPTNDWDSHRPMLYLATSYVNDDWVELGAGPGSTELLFNRAMVNVERTIQMTSLETNEDWLYSCSLLVDSYDEADKYMPCGVLFIDCAPGEIRKGLIERHANNATVIIVHDTEPGAEYVYGMAAALNSFKYRCDLVIEGMPQTTAVSNLYDVSTWKGVYNGKFYVV